MTSALSLVVRTPARMTPAHRDIVLADPLADLLASVAPTSHLAVRETVVTQAGEPVEQVLSVAVSAEDAESVIARILDLEVGMPKGSTVEVNDKVATFGVLDGVGAYLPTPTDDAEASGPEVVAGIAAALQARTAGVGQLWSVWQGPETSALYFYGPDGAALRDALATAAADVPAASLRVVELVPLVEAG